MSKQCKVLIPLLGENMMLEDISEDVGFYDAYTSNIDKPYLDSNIFLVYSNLCHTDERWYTDRKIKGLSTYYGSDTIYIKDKPFTVYILKVIPKKYLDIMDGIVNLTTKERDKINKFWRCTDNYINRFICDKYNKISCEESNLPLNDNYVTLDDVYFENEKSSGLLIET